MRQRKQLGIKCEFQHVILIIITTSINVPYRLCIYHHAMEYIIYDGMDNIS